MSRPKTNNPFSVLTPMATYEDLPDCVFCNEEYDSAPCYGCPSYDGDLELLAEALEEDSLKRGVPLKVVPR